MDPVTLQLILTLIPLAEKLVFDIGGKLIELNTSDLTREDMLSMLAASRSSTWPELKFVSTKKPE